MSIPRGDLPRKLCARYTKEFAYPTIKDRLPVILTKIIDRLFSSKDEIKKLHGEAGCDELKGLIGECSRLKLVAPVWVRLVLQSGTTLQSEMQTNKPLELLKDDLPDVQIWNDRLSLKVMEENEWRDGDDDNEEECVSQPDGVTVASWFHSSWLLSEAYFYRRLVSVTKQFPHLRDLDMFREPKVAGTVGSKLASSSLGHFLLTSLQTGVKDASSNEQLFSLLLYASLWGNKCDLSISAGADNFQTDDILRQLEHLNHNCVCNRSSDVWNFVNSFKGPSNLSCHKTLKRFDVILDNTGFELFTDLCIADYFTSLYHCQVRFHAKAMPWFVSDVTKEDFGWLIEWMATSGEAALEELHHKWSGYIKEGKWVVEDHPFWSYPHSFHSMQSVAPALYEHLSQADLLLFKGDLNYRKLTGDRRWDYSEKFERSVGEFRPAPLVSLRTLKCDLVLDVPQEVIARETLKDKDWMLYGTHAVVQFLP